MAKKIQIFTSKMAKNLKKEQKTQANLKTNIDSSIKTKEKGQIGSIVIDDPSSSQIIRELQAGDCTLFFYKITNGSFRKMKCTLSGQKPESNRANRPGVIVVWDLEAQQWRSFYPNRVFRLIRNEETDAE